MFPLQETQPTNMEGNMIWAPKQRDSTLHWTDSWWSICVPISRRIRVELDFGVFMEVVPLSLIFPAHVESHQYDIGNSRYVQFTKDCAGWNFKPKSYNNYWKETPFNWTVKEGDTTNWTGTKSSIWPPFQREMYLGHTLSFPINM